MVDFVEDDLEDLICSGLSATQVLWGYGGDIPARRSISSQIGLGRWASVCDVFVARGGSDSGYWNDNWGGERVRSVV